MKYSTEGSHIPRHKKIWRKYIEQTEEIGFVTFFFDVMVKSYQAYKDSWATKKCHAREKVVAESMFLPFLVMQRAVRRDTEKCSIDVFVLERT